MSDEYDKVIYEEDSRLLSWLVVRQCTELLGDDAEQNLDLMTDEEKQWVRVIAKYGKDEQPFNFVNVYGEVATSVYDNTPEDEPKGSDWVTSETVRPKPKITIVQDWSSDCGKPLTKCTGVLRNGDLCIHTARTVSAELEPDIRQEFKEDWNSMADRPTENFFLGLAGVIFTDDDWLTNHTTCPNCFVLTPTQTDECTVCDFNLVSN
jgi:hypothetical protein